MKILVCVKMVPDTICDIALKAGAVDLESLKYIINPYDEFAIEEGVKWRDKLGGQLRMATVGPEVHVAALRKGLAMGVDDAVLIKTPANLPVDPTNGAVLLANAAREFQADLVICGRQAIDTDGGITPVRIAESLGWEWASWVTRFNMEGSTYQAQCDYGHRQVVVTGTLPLVFSAQKGLNEPRKPSMPNIVKAKTKPVKILSGNEWTLSREEGVAITGFQPPTREKRTRLLEGDPKTLALQLVQLLKNEARVI